MAKIYMVNASAGTAGIVDTDKKTVGDFLTSQMGFGFNPDKFLIRHNGKCPDSPQQEIQDGDTLSVTLTKIEGHDSIVDFRLTIVDCKASVNE